MITDSRIAWGDQLGAQLTTLANLFYIAEENKQQLVLWEELKDYRRGYQFLDVFNISDINMMKRTGKIKSAVIERYCVCSTNDRGKTDWQKNLQRFYNNRLMYYIDRFFYEIVRMNYRDFERISGKTEGGVHCAPQLLQLNHKKNYDINGGFGTYKDWGKYREVILNRIKFKKEIVEKATETFCSIKTKHEYRVAVHFRRTDYLVMSSLCLDNDYYKEAMNMFDSQTTSFLVFSDDIEEIRKFDLFNDKDVVFITPQVAGVDMCLMSMCNANIIANSSYSFWAAMLNEYEDKRVICPFKFIGDSCSSLGYINGNWYPEDWTALKVKV